MSSVLTATLPPALSSPSPTLRPLGSLALSCLSLGAGSALVFAGACEIPIEIWDETFGDSLKSLDYYRLLEETMAGDFLFRYLLLCDASGHPYALQPLIVVSQDLAASMGGILRHIVSACRHFVPRFMKSQMLMAGCLVGDGRLGVRPGTSRKTAASVLGQALLAYAKFERISFITVKDFPVAERLEFEPLVQTGYARIPSFPSVKLDLNFDTFEQYIEQKLGPATRKDLRRKLRRTAKLTPPLELEVLTESASVIDEIHPLYLQVAQRSAVSFEVFTRDYFLQASQFLPGACRYFVWRQNGRAVAFSFCTIWGDTLYDNDIGLDYRVAHDLNLYYVTFRDLIDWALREGLRSYCSSPFNYGPKLQLRLDLQPHDLYVRHTSMIVNQIMKRLAPLFGPTRSDPVLRRHLHASRT